MAPSLCNCFWLMRDWKPENLANDKERSTTSFPGSLIHFSVRNGERRLPLYIVYSFYDGFSGILGCLPVSKKNPEISFESEMEHFFFRKSVWKL